MTSKRSYQLFAVKDKTVEATYAVKRVRAKEAELAEKAEALAKDGYAVTTAFYTAEGEYQLFAAKDTSPEAPAVQYASRVETAVTGENLADRISAMVDGGYVPVLLPNADGSLTSILGTQTVAGRKLTAVSRHEDDKDIATRLQSVDQEGYLLTSVISHGVQGQWVAAVRTAEGEVKRQASTYHELFFGK